MILMYLSLLCAILVYIGIDYRYVISHYILLVTRQHNLSKFTKCASEYLKLLRDNSTGVILLFTI